MDKLLPLFLITFLTILSGIADSQGFTHASLVWKKDSLVWHELAITLVTWIVGILFYLVSVRFMQQVGIRSAEIQTTIWFAVTIIGVALTNGKFFTWNFSNQLISVAILFGISLLILRTGG